MKISTRRLDRFAGRFDRMTQYRVAAAFLYVPFFMTIIALVQGREPWKMWPIWVTRGIQWTGLALLTLALALDAFEVYAGKRRVRQMIETKQTRTHRRQKLKD